jgi:hypothetical protein
LRVDQRGKAALFSFPFAGGVRVNLPKERRPVDDAVCWDCVFSGELACLVVRRRNGKFAAIYPVEVVAVGFDAGIGGFVGLSAGTAFLLGVRNVDEGMTAARVACEGTLSSGE